MGRVDIQGGGGGETCERARIGLGVGGYERRGKGVTRSIFWGGGTHTFWLLDFLLLSRTPHALNDLRYRSGPRTGSAGRAVIGKNEERISYSQSFRMGFNAEGRQGGEAPF